MTPDHENEMTNLDVNIDRERVRLKDRVVLKVDKRLQ